MSHLKINIEELTPLVEAIIKKTSVSAKLNPKIFKKLVHAFVKKELAEKSKPKLINGKELYSIEDAEFALSVSRTTLHNWRKKGILNTVKIEGRVYITKCSINSLLSSRTTINKREL